MNIGIDIDGVINNFCDEYWDFLEKNYNIILDKSIYGHSDYLKNELGDIGYDEMINTFYNIDLSLEKFAKFFIKKLKDNNKIYIITARKYDSSDDTIKWLKEKGIVYDDILFNAGNKGKACINNNIDIMIEDSPYNVYDLLKRNVKVLLYDRPYNQEFYEGKFLHRVKNWVEIYNYLK
jgi:uncharacterized HAD superfamily protein